MSQKRRLRRVSDSTGELTAREPHPCASQKIGVSADPEFLRHPLSSRDKVAIFISDGVCEYMTNEQVLNLVMKHSPDPHKAAEVVVAEACVPKLPAPRPHSPLCVVPHSHFPCQSLACHHCYPQCLLVV